MTLLGTINTENLRTGPATCVSLCGARYHGCAGGRVFFTDPVTKAPLSLPEAEVTIGNVWRKLAEQRLAMENAR